MNGSTKIQESIIKYKFICNENLIPLFFLNFYILNQLETYIPQEDILDKVCVEQLLEDFSEEQKQIIYKFYSYYLLNLCIGYTEFEFNTLLKFDNIVYTFKKELKSI